MKLRFDSIEADTPEAAVAEMRDLSPKLGEDLSRWTEVFAQEFRLEAEKTAKNKAIPARAVQKPSSTYLVGPPPSICRVIGRYLSNPGRCRHPT
jgi:hypothetical protein